MTEDDSQHRQQQVAVPPQADAARASSSLSSSYSEWPTQDNIDGIKLAFDHLVGEDALLGLEQLSSLLQDVGLQAPSDVVLGLVEAQASSQWALTFDETMQVCASIRAYQIGKSQSLPPQSPSGSLRALSQRRAYMDSGWLAQDQAVIAYMKKLELHKKRCERDGKYLEARAASVRLAELKTQEAQRMRQAIMERQARSHKYLEVEIALAEEAFQKDKAQLADLWAQRTHQFQQAVDLQVSKQSQKHAAQLEAFQYAVGSRRPAKPHCSKELLNQRRVIDLLARQGCYSKAAAVQQATNGMEAAEMKATLATFEAEVGVKEAKLRAKQAQEMEVLQGRGARGRDQLKRAHAQELEQRQQRLRNLKAELQNLQRLEIVHLENFLDGQARAGKQMPLEERGFKRDGMDYEYDLVGI
ncbi:MAG: hypothetical protein FRX49_05772 [Trebouxia sp. A1-2]|nr:MAG: hypothetical protein FRX49_05772 [Trebouxia sp. A1-2]